MSSAIRSTRGKNMSKSSILVVAIGAFAVGALLDRFVTSVGAATERISAQIIDVPALKQSDMGGTPDRPARSKNYVTVDGMTLGVQFGATSKHMHPIANEIQYIIEGTGKFWLGDKEVEYKPGDLIII